MAEILSQNDIDDLLNSSLVEEDYNEVSSVPSGKQKVFKPPKQDNSGFKYEYRSPVIKRESVIFNPNLPIESTRKKVVVRSLANYASYLRKKKTQMD